MKCENVENLLEQEDSNESPNLYAEYSRKKGTVSADQVRSYTYVNSKLYFESFCSLLKNSYPNKPDIMEGLLWIKSHGIGFRLAKGMIEKGLKIFPEGYLALGPLPQHDKVDFDVVIHPDEFPIETFPTLTFKKISDYLKEKGARVHYPKKIYLEPIKAVHTAVELDPILLQRAKQSETIQRIDDFEFPLDKDVFKFIRKAPSVMFHAYGLKNRIVIAIPGVLSNHSTTDRGYFNSDAILADFLAKQDKKVTILNLNANFANGTTELCLGKEYITIIGIQTNSFVDTIINSRDHSISEQNSFQFNLDPGLNGDLFLKELEKAVENIPQDTDCLIISFGTNLYVFDSVGLQCIEEKYFRKFGELIAKKSISIPKIIITPAGGYEEYAPGLFTQFCIGVGGTK